MRVGLGPLRPPPPPPTRPPPPSPSTTPPTTTPPASADLCWRARRSVETWPPRSGCRPGEPMIDTVRERNRCTTSRPRADNDLALQVVLQPELDRLLQRHRRTGTLGRGAKRRDAHQVGVQHRERPVCTHKHPRFLSNVEPRCAGPLQPRHGVGSYLSLMCRASNARLARITRMRSL